MRACLCFSALLLGFSALAAHAQERTADGTLKGIGAVKVVASIMDPATDTCGLNTRALVASLEEQFAVSGLTTKAPSDHVATVTALTLHEPIGDGCTSALMLGAYTAIRYFDTTANRTQEGYVVGWQRGQMVASPRGAHPGAAKQALKQLGDAFLKDWRQQNGR